MIFKELTVSTTTQGSELIADILSDLGSDGVAIYDSNDLKSLINSEVIWDYIDEKALKDNKSVRVIGYYQEDNFDDSYLAVIERLEELKEDNGIDFGSLEVTFRTIDDQDWVNVWKTFYKPIKIGKIVIVPKWIKYQTEADEKILLIDPGMAFGTGEHESTRLCLSLLSDLDIRDRGVLDIGAGSGILGIAGALSGASSVYMCDIDETAVKCAKENVALNNLGDNIIVEQSNLAENNPPKGYLVFANLTADILKLLGKDLSKCILNDGYVIISGIINARSREIESYFEHLKYVIDKKVVDGEWTALRLKYYGN